jgi:hypothetical protein
LAQAPSLVNGRAATSDPRPRADVGACEHARSLLRSPSVHPLFRAVALPFTLTALGCASTAAEAPPPAAVASTEVAPYPYTVDQIRTSCHGRVIEFQLEALGKPPTRERWEFADIDPDTARITTTTLGSDGTPAGAPEVETAKWAELHEHARFPKETTTINEESLATPFGALACQRYVVTTNDGTKTLWFAKTLAGPPVKMTVAKSGQTVMTMTMLSTRN